MGSIPRGARSAEPLSSIRWAHQNPIGHAQPPPPPCYFRVHLTIQETPPPPAEGSAPSMKLALGKSIGGKALGGKALGKKKGGFAFGRKASSKSKAASTKKPSVSTAIFCVLRPRGTLWCVSTVNSRVLDLRIHYGVHRPCMYCGADPMTGPSFNIAVLDNFRCATHSLHIFVYIPCLLYISSFVESKYRGTTRSLYVFFHITCLLCYTEYSVC